MGHARRTGAGAAAVVLVGVLASPAFAGSHTIPSHTLAGTSVPVDSSYTSQQGGATDEVGGYWYNIVRKDGGSGPDRIDLVKTKMYSSTTTAHRVFAPRSGNRSNLLGHGNDIAYNSDTKKLLIPAWNNDGSVQDTDQGKAVRIVDPSTLQVEGTEHLAYDSVALCYDATRKRYVGGKLGQYSIYDTSFNELSRSPKLSIAGVGQGIDCDKQYIYVITSPNDVQKNNVITVYDWSFAKVATYTHPSTSEGEHLTHQRGTFYLGFNVGAGKLYRLDGFQFTVSYKSGGGTGSMASTIALYGESNATSPNAFTRAGYEFAGWQVSRSMDDKTRYRNPKDPDQSGWYIAGQQPSGWTPYLYGSGTTVTSTTLRGAVYLTATWRPTS